MDINTAVSEVIAVVILIAVFAVAVGIVGVVMLSNPQGDEAPAMLASVMYDNSTADDHRLILRHEGGDPLRKGEFQIFVNGEERTDEFSGESESTDWTDWENGQTLTLGLGSDPKPDGVLITGAGIRGSGSAWVLHLIDEGGIVTVVPTPSPTPGTVVAAFSANSTAGSAPLIVQFTDTSTGNPNEWYWNFGDNTTSGVQNPTHTFTTPGFYTVRLTASTTDDSDTTTRTITVVGPPTANFSASTTSGIIPLEVQFTDHSTGTPASWSWDFGDGTNATAQNPSHTYTTAGTYTVILTVSNAAGTDTATSTIRVSACAGLGLAGTYYPNREWIGEGVTRIDPRIWFADNEANTSWQKSGTDEYNWPIATLGKDDQFSVIYEGYLIVPEDATYTFYLTSDDGSWLWIDDMDTVLIDNGGYHSSTTKTANIHLTAGSHQIRAKMFENLGKAVFHLEWSSPAFARTPVEDFCHDPIAVAASFTAAPQSGTAPLQVQLTDLSTGAPTAWLWDFGDGTTSTEQHPVHIYTAPGTYTVSLTAANAAFSDTATRTDLITAETPTITEGFWPMDEGSGSIVYDKSGNGYNGTITGAGWISCADRGYLVFDGSSDSVSIPNSAGLNPTNAVTYEAWAYPTEYDTDKVIQKRDWDGHGLDLDKWNGWQGGVTTTSSSKTTIEWGEGRPTLNRWYLLALTYDGSTLRLYVDGEEKASRPLTGTLKTSTSPVYIGSDANTQKWFNGSIANAAIYSTALSPQEIGAHYAAFTPAGCPADAAFSADVVSGTAPLTVQFTDLSTRHPTAWLWDFGDGTSSRVQNPFHIYADPGTYTVSLTASNLFGPGTETKTGYITVGGSFIDFIIDENVFVYGNTLKFSGNTVTGPGATVVITGGLVTSDLNGGASISVSEIYIDGDVTLDGGSAGLGSATEPGNIYVNGDLTLGSGSRNIYGDVYVAGDFLLRGASIYGNAYVDGDLTLDWTPSLASDARIYYTGTFTHPDSMSQTILDKCIYQATVPGFDMPDQQIPPTKPAEWYAARGYVSGGALTSNMKIYADTYSPASIEGGSAANNVIIIARNGDIDLSKMGWIDVKGVFFAPKGKITFRGGSFEGVVIARDGFFVTSGGTTVTFKNIEEYISNPDDYPF